MNLGSGATNTLSFQHCVVMPECHGCCDMGRFTQVEV